MRARNATLIALLACAGGMASAGTASADAQCPDADATPGVVDVARLADATLCLLNDQRAQAGLALLTTNRKLEAAAGDYSKLMVRDHFFAHVSPSGSTLESRLAAVSYTGRGRDWTIGENIGWGSGARSTPRVMVEAWMQSPGHRRNILDSGFQEVGIGIVEGAPIASASTTTGTYTTEFGTRGESSFSARRRASAARKARREAHDAAKRARAGSANRAR